MKKYVVIGDVMLDRYIMGHVNRISPEAPVPIVDVKLEYGVLGGAANTARNISTIAGGENVTLIGSLGEDEAGIEVRNLLEAENINFMSLYNDMTITTVKQRIFSGDQQLLRFDIDNKEDVQIPLEMIEDVLNEADIIIISDYSKGVITRDLMLSIVRFRSKMIIDPKPENWAKYPGGVFLMTPNESEFHSMRFVKPEPDYMLVTKGKNGMSLIEYGREIEDRNYKDLVTNITSKEVSNCEVIGAGDTVTAIMAICIANGVSMKESAMIANECARYVVSQSGTAVVPIEVFKEVFASYKFFIGS
jgi:D-beta-D-heptose 7-phosphate kinase/D-beta-D-heptose 1-phosphate adenosyltransferase